MFRFDYDAGRCVFEYLTREIRVSKLFRPRGPNHHIGDRHLCGGFSDLAVTDRDIAAKPPQRCLSPMWWFWWLEDELVVVGRSNAAFGGGTEGGEGVTRERHGPAQTAAGSDGTGKRHDAPGYAGDKT